MTFLPIVIGALGTGTKNWYKDWRTGGLENNGTSGDHPNYSIIEIGQNTEKSPRDLRKLAVTQTSVKDYQLMLKYSQGVNNNNNNQILLRNNCTKNVNMNVQRMRFPNLSA